MSDLGTSANFIQLLGYLAGATCSCCFIAKKDLWLRLVLIVGVSLYTLHFYLLGAHAAAATEAVTVLWNATSLFAPRFSPKVRWAALILVCTLYALAGIVCWEGLHSVLPVFACIWFAIIMVVWTDTRLRVALMGCDGLWLTNGFLTGSHGGVVFSTLALIINCSILYRRSAQNKTSAQAGRLKGSLA